MRQLDRAESTGKKLEALFTSEVEPAEALHAAETSARGAIGASSSAFTRAALFARAAFSSASSVAASLLRVAVVQEHVRARGVQPPRDRRADAPRAAGDEGRLAGERLVHECLEF
jgi:hypothetical protein